MVANYYVKVGEWKVKREKKLGHKRLVGKVHEKCFGKEWVLLLLCFQVSKANRKRNHFPHLNGQCCTKCMLTNGQPAYKNIKVKWALRLHIQGNDPIYGQPDQDEGDAPL